MHTANLEYPRTYHPARAKGGNSFRLAIPVDFFLVANEPQEWSMLEKDVPQWFQVGKGSPDDARGWVGKRVACEGCIGTGGAVFGGSWVEYFKQCFQYVERL